METLPEMLNRIAATILYFLTPVSILLSYILFPVFLFVQRQNREKDELYTFLGLNILQIIGASFYIPIMIDISKLTHLTSAALNKPQRYIMFQIITHLISRIALLPCAYIFFRGYSLTALTLATFMDIFLTPLIIQLSYLLCNRKNLQTFFKSSPKVIIKSLIFPNYRPTQVQPEVIQSTKY